MMFIKSIHLVFFLFFPFLFAYADIVPKDLTCEYLHNPMVIDVKQPRLSWINVAEDGERRQFQTAYHIQVASSLDKLEQGNADLWDSNKTYSDQSFLIHYAGNTLKPRQECWWRVRVWDVKGKVSAWSKPAYWNMGLLESSDWIAKWIGAPWQTDEATALSGDKEIVPAPLFRKRFKISKEIADAKIYISGLGYFELYLNGKKVSNDVLVPSQTNYGKREGLDVTRVTIDDNFRGYNVLYLCYDLKKHLQPEENVLGCILGNGFYNAPVNWTMPYGSPRLIAQLYITYADGSEDVIVSDTSWETSKSAIISDGIYSGEHYDARLENANWCLPSNKKDSWSRAGIRKAPEGQLQAQMCRSDKVMEYLYPRKISVLGTGHYKIDFGTEISGWVHLHNMQGESGRKIEIRYLCESPNGTSSYIMKGDGMESYAPRFTWFVFREVEIMNWPGEMHAEDVIAEVVYTEIESVGEFKCSNSLFNQIHKIWRRSFTDNLHGNIVSDCPHRERSGYTGDGQVACVTAMHNYNVTSLYTKWIKDIFLSQNRETGYVPNAAPWQPGCGGGVAFSAAMNIMPWEFYVHYGDKDLLRVNYEGMKEQIRYMKTWVQEDGTMLTRIKSNGEVSKWHNLGEWNPPFGFPPKDLVHTYYYWRCVDVTAKAAKALGYIEDNEELRILSDTIKAAFHKKFYHSDTHTYGPFGSNIFALAMGVPDTVKEVLIETVKNELAGYDGHLYTGVFGTQLFFETLTDCGLNELAYEAMNKEDMPSYGWWISQGATTTWEEWNGNNSRNHPMFGGGITWFYRKLVGIDTDEEQAGYKHIIIKPYPPEGIKYASFSMETPYGKTSVRWEKRSCSFNMNVEVPVGSYATVHIPMAFGEKIKESGVPIDKVEEIAYNGTDDGYALFRIQSGKYDFEVEYNDLSRKF